MFNLFKMGGPLFMGILTGILFIVLLIAIYHLFLVIRKDYKDIDETRKRLTYIKSIGLFGLVTGILGQMIGLYSAFSAIENALDVSPAIMAGGLKVSMITPIYGVVIFLVSYFLWVIIDFIASKKA
ncbi:MAG: MotA/TolQ/ExbB proton channel family protein [Bacteroidales bacterium]|nr:MotA/TolQ/ExbB proton channel family protein [Bacteroidales bacterium]